MLVQDFVSATNRLSKNATLSLGVAFLPLFICSWLFFPDHGLWLDEAFSIYYSNMSWHLLIDNIVAAEANMPLYYGLLKIYIFLGGDDVIYVRTLSAIFGVAALIAVYFFCRSYLGSVVAFWATFFLSFNPFFFQYFWEARTYSIEAFFGVVMLWIFWKAYLTNKTRYWLVYGFVCGLGLYSHIFLALLVISQHLFLLMILVLNRNVSGYFRNLLVANFSMFIVAAPILIIFLFTGSEAETVSWIKTIGYRELWGVFENLLKTKYSLGRFPSLLSFSLICFFLLGTFVALAYMVFVKKRKDYYVIVVYISMCCIVPLLLLFALQLIRPVFVERYVIFSVPFLLIAIGAMISKINSRIIQAGLIVSLALTQVVGLSDSDSRSRLDFRPIYLELSRRCKAGDSFMVAAPGLLATYQYYAKQFSLDSCIDKLIPLELALENFHSEVKLTDLPKLDSNERLWLLFGFAGEAGKSIYRLKDKAYMETNGYKRALHRKYPLGVSLSLFEANASSTVN